MKTENTIRYGIDCRLRARLGRSLGYCPPFSIGSPVTYQGEEEHRCLIRRGFRNATEDRKVRPVVHGEDDNYPSRI
jgi:hypothetical protein